MTTNSLSTQAPDLLRLLAHDLRWSLVTALARGDHRVHELVRLLDQPMNLVSYHLKQLRDQQLVTERRSSADGRDIYYSLDLDLLRTRYFATGAALHPAMDACAIDIQSHRSKHPNEYLEQPFDYVITVCDNVAETCPLFPGPAQRIHPYAACAGYRTGTATPK